MRSASRSVVCHVACRVGCFEFAADDASYDHLAGSCGLGTRRSAPSASRTLAADLSRFFEARSSIDPTYRWPWPFLRGGGLYGDGLAWEGLAEKTKAHATERVRVTPALSQTSVEFRHAGRETGRVDGQAGPAAVVKILIVGARIGNRQKVWGNSATVVPAEMWGDVMLGRPAGRFVSIPQKPTH